MFQDVVVRRIGENRKRPRVYLDMPELERSLFKPGTAYKLTLDEAKTKVSLVVDAGGDRVVSRKKRGEKAVPVIDLSSFRVLAMFAGLERVRIVFMQGRLFVLPLASELAQRERLARVSGKMERGEELALASLCHGVGLMSFAAHQGLRNAGVKVRTAVINEIDGDHCDQSRAYNEVWDADTKGLQAPMQEIVQDDWLMQRLPRVEILEAGIPCSGASKAGVAKRGLDCMEAHPEVGHLLLPAFALIQKMQPAVVLLENVSDYQGTGSAFIARSMFRDMGYEVGEVTLNAADFGCLEARTRWFMVATTRGIRMDLSELAPQVRSALVLKDVLEDIDENDIRWSTRSYLVEKAKRDKLDGKGFKMQLVTAEDTRIPVLRKGYAKGGSCDPFLSHPTKAGFMRKLTAREHARVKNCDERIITGMSEYRAHAALGQGVAIDPVKALFRRIGEMLKASVGCAAGENGICSSEGYALKGTG